MQRFAGPTSSVNAVALDSHQNIYVGGIYSGTITIGTNTFVSAGGNDVFISKLSRNGEILWAMNAGGTNDDAINDLITTRNGAVFVTGRFDLGPDAPASVPIPVTDVLVARVDNCAFTWTDALPQETNASVNAIALGPDEFPWVTGASTRAFLRRYHPNGAVQAMTTVGNNLFTPTALAVSDVGEPYILGNFAGTIDLGTTNVTASWGSEHFTAGLSSNGVVRWVWVKARFYSNYEPLTDIRCTPDGGTATIGFWDSGLPQGRLVIAKHSATGHLEWRVDRTGFFKSIYTALALSVDAHGCLHVVGNAMDALRGSIRRPGIGVWVWTPTGDLLSQEFITCGRGTDQLGGNAIAVTDSGETVIVGYLQGRPRFGTNNFVGFADSITGFVARRATVAPTLAVGRTGTSVRIEWPRTAAPFALQHVALLGSNEWRDLSMPPILTATQANINLSAGSQSSFFRLRRTNESVNFPPALDAIAVSPATRLSDGRWIVSTDGNAATNVIITAWHTDWNYDSVGVAWYDHTGTNRLNEVFTSSSYITTFDGEEFPMYVAKLDEPTLAFPVGTNTIFVVGLDYQSSTTNTFSFEVVKNE